LLNQSKESNQDQLVTKCSIKFFFLKSFSFSQLGIIPILSRLQLGNLLDRRLCRPGCDHIGSTWLDQGWSCGYKNFQMLLSSLSHDPQYSTYLFGQTNRDIPSVSYLQNLIEKAWSAGFDSDGREQLNGRLINSTKWIGPTEVMACLANLNIK